MQKDTDLNTHTCYLDYSNKLSFLSYKEMQEQTITNHASAPGVVWGCGTYQCPSIHVRDAAC